MPTVHVRPDCDQILREVADAVYKCRKVLVVTGAGISTNSGIPDFRSENGLYSLIQAEYDGASGLERPLPAEESKDDEAASVKGEFDSRPTKRRRTSLEGQDIVNDNASSSTVFVAPNGSPSKGEDSNDKMSVSGITLEQDAQRGCVSTAQDGEDSEALAIKSTTLPFSAQLTSSPPCMAMGLWPDKDRELPSTENATLDTGRPPQLKVSTTTPPSSKMSTPKISHLPVSADHSLFLASSSPLSSPPPILSDPYQQSFDSSLVSSSNSESETDDSAATSESGETPPSSNDFSASQCSASGRTALPNLKGRDLFDVSIWQDPIKTSIFYTFITNLRRKTRDVQPTATHRFISHLRDRRKLVRCYTQNIDQLEEKVGLSTSLRLGAGYRYRFGTRLSQRGGPPNRLQPEERQETGAPVDGEPGEGPEKMAEIHQESCAGGPDAHPTRAEALQEGANSPAVDSADEPAKSECQDRSGPAAGAIRDTNSSSEQPAATSQDFNSGAAFTIANPPTKDAFPRIDSRTDSALDPGTAPSELVASAEIPLPDTETLPESVSQPSDGPSAERAADQQLARGPPLRGGVECVYLHGSLERLRCFQCSRTSDWDVSDTEAETLSGRQPDCPHCAGATAAREERGKRALGVGKLRPDIVLYGEEHPQSHLIAPIVEHDLGLGPDMLIIMGTSLRVYGLKALVKQFAKAVHTKGGKVVFINFSKPSESVWADVIDFWIEWDCDAWVEDLREKKPAIWDPPTRRSTVDDSGDGTVEKLRREDSAASGKARRASSGQAKVPAKKEKKEKEKGKKKERAQRDSAMDGKVAAQAKPASSAVLRRSPKKGKVKKAAKPDAKRPMAVRDDTTNGAICTAKVMDELARIFGRATVPFPSEAKLERKETPVPLPILPRARPKHRRSAPAALGEKLQTRRAAKAIRTTDETPAFGAFSAGPRKKKLLWADTSAPAASSPLAFSELAHDGSAAPPDGGSKPASGDNSILAAVKSNPRQRKRKTIDGEEVVLPVIQSRVPGGGKSTAKAKKASHTMLPKPVATELSALSFCYPQSRLRAEALSVHRPHTPVHLAPFRHAAPLGPLLAQQLEPLEPEPCEMGPTSPIFSNPGVTPRTPFQDPFCLDNPLTNTLHHPPAWMSGGPGWDTRKLSMPLPGDDKIGGLRRSGDWGPHDQLEKETEAAMMLSVLRNSCT